MTLWSCVYCVNLEWELFSQSQRQAQKPSSVAQKRGWKVGLGNAAACSCHVLGFARQQLRSWHRHARWRIQHGYTCCNADSERTGDAFIKKHLRIFYSQDGTGYCAGNAVVNNVGHVLGRNIPFPFNFASQLSILGAIQLDKSTLRSYWKIVVLNKTLHNIVKRKP